MKCTVFYSWQADLNNKLNRSFIGDALKKAAKTLSGDSGYTIDTVIDRDTFGLGGSPAIVESITGKIANSDIFICDVSIINSKETGKKTPNPNVLFELGFASAILGWDRIIMIQNTAFGDVEKLPFDLRGRRILQYKLDETIESKAEEKEKVVISLVNTLKVALRHYGESDEKKDKIFWWGNWNIESKTKVRGGNLHIYRVSSESFLFKLSLFDGARSGLIEARAQILTPHSALARINSLCSNEDCTILFRRRIIGDSWWIDVEVGGDCGCFHGHGASFEGAYKHNSEQVINMWLLDELDLNELQRMMGRFMETFLENFQLIGENVDTDNSETIFVWGGVKGLHGNMASAVALDNLGNIWCAFIDPLEDVIRYFSNNALESIYLRNWIKEIEGKQIIENEDNHPYESEY